MKTFPAALLQQNHERTTKAVERLNAKAWAGIKYEAVLEEGQLGVIVKYVKPGLFHDRNAVYNETFRYTTRLEQTIGWPVSYSNKYTAGNMGSMCKGLDDAENKKRNERAAVQSAERRVEKLREELAREEAALVALKAELGQ